MDIQVSVIIKALNEQENIARCIESVMNEVKNLKSEILVVDSLSTDCTVEIAKKYPVEIIQFSTVDDRNCGAAAQLGYQQSTGNLIYLIDGDMEIVPGFLDKAIKYLQEHINVAGVGGLLIDTDISSISDVRRSREYSKIQSTQLVNSLGGGGLYRREMIEQVKYFSHRGLRACEEAELGVRLISSGWSLVRLATPATYHTGHKESSTQSIKRLWANGRLAAHGVFLKSSIGTKWWWKTFRHEWFLVMPFAVNFSVLLTYGIVCMAYGFSPFLLAGIFIGFWLPICILLAVKQKSFSAAIFSICTWHILAAASIRVLFSPIKSPLEKINFRILTNPDQRKENDSQPFNSHK